MLFDAEDETSVTQAATFFVTYIKSVDRFLAAIFTKKIDPLPAVCLHFFKVQHEHNSLQHL
jgi:hypothetical protein